MKVNPLRRLLAAAAVAMVVSQAGAEVPLSLPPVDSVRVLAIGNSFSRDATAFLPALAEAAGRHWTFGHAMIGGAPLSVHMKGVAAFEANPNDPAGKPYKITVDGTSRKVSLRELLESQPWYYVTIQQASILSYRPETFEPYADQLVAYIHRYAPQAKLLIHETWAYRTDHPVFKNGFDQPQMYHRLHDDYRWLARYENAAGLIPTGTAFQNVREDARWQPSILPVDPSTYVYPAYPPQDHDLNVNYTWDLVAGVQKLVPDRKHSTVIGRYLGACVWYEFFFGDVRGNAFRPSTMSDADAALIREIAHKTVADHLRPRAADAPLSPLPTTRPATPPVQAAAPAAPTPAAAH